MLYNPRQKYEKFYNMYDNIVANFFQKEYQNFLGSKKELEFRELVTPQIKQTVINLSNKELFDDFLFYLNGDCYDNYNTYIGWICRELTDKEIKQRLQNWFKTNTVKCYNCNTEFETSDEKVINDKKRLCDRCDSLIVQG